MTATPKTAAEKTGFVIGAVLCALLLMWFVVLIVVGIVSTWRLL